MIVLTRDEARQVAPLRYLLRTLKVSGRARRLLLVNIAGAVRMSENKGADVERDDLIQRPAVTTAAGGRTNSKLKPVESLDLQRLQM